MLGLYVLEELIRRDAAAKEGDLTQLESRYTSNRALAAVAALIPSISAATAAQSVHEAGTTMEAMLYVCSKRNPGEAREAALEIMRLCEVAGIKRGALPRVLEWFQLHPGSKLERLSEEVDKSFRAHFLVDGKEEAVSALSASKAAAMEDAASRLLEHLPEADVRLSRSGLGK